MPELQDFEGQEVVEVGVEIPNAAGGLHDAMKFDPIEQEIADEGYVVFHYAVKKVRYEPVTKDEFDGPLRRVHVYHVDQGALIDAEIIEGPMTEQRERIQKLKDEAEGTPSLLDAGEGDDDSNVHDLPVGATGDDEPTAAAE